MRAKTFAMLLLFLILYSLLSCQTLSFAQQAAAGSVNDMRCYQIICQSMDKKEFAPYYKIIRAKIQSSLSKNYKFDDKEGDVVIFFMLKNDGSLMKLDVDKTGSTRDEELIKTVVLSVRQASPFPHFPKNITVSQMSFNVKISFKES